MVQTFDKLEKDEYMNVDSEMHDLSSFLTFLFLFVRESLFSRSPTPFVDWSNKCLVVFDFASLKAIFTTFPVCTKLEKYLVA